MAAAAAAAALEHAFRGRSGHIVSHSKNVRGARLKVIDVIVIFFLSLLRHGVIEVQQCWPRLYCGSFCVRIHKHTPFLLLHESLPSFFSQVGLPNLDPGVRTDPASHVVGS